MLREFLHAGCALAALGLASPLAAQQSASAMIAAPKIEFTEWKLGNGLRVIAIPDPTTANVMTSMWYEVGSKNDPDGRSGFAHLFEHILSRKTENMPYNMINRLTEDVGGVRNASTGDDRTNYYEIVPAQYLETMLWTHAERMARPVVDDEVFERERSIVKEELRQRVLAPPYGIMQRFLITENAYDVLPQRRPGIGSIEQLDSATLDDARAFHQAYYGPDTATLIVAGNFDMAQLKGLVDKYFAPILRRPRPQSIEITAREPRRTHPRSVAGTGPNVPLPAVGAIYQLPASDSPDLAPLTVLDAILSAGENSRMHKALVRTGKAVDFGEYIDSTQEGGNFPIYAILNPATDQAEVAGIIAAEVERVRSEPVSEAELAEAKNTLFANALSSRETASGRAFELGEALVTIGDAEAADRRLEEIGRVTAADVQRVAREWLAPESAVTFTYNQGSGDPSTYANPAPMPSFGTVPPPVGQPALLRDEANREAPPPPVAAPHVARAEIVESRLANGIPLVSAQTGEVPLATMTVVLPGGTSTDPVGKAGLAALAASVANKGTATRSAEEIAARLESLGASMNATAGADGVFFSLTAPATNLAAAGEVLSDVIRHAAYPDDELELERARTIDSLRVALKDPGSLANMIAPRVFYGDAPYGSVATVQSLPAITRADLLAWREAMWHPATAEIVVSGGIAPAESKRIAEALFGDWRSSAPAPAPVDHPAGQSPAPRVVVIDMPEAGQAAVLAGMRVTSRGDSDYYPLLLANSVLGVGSNGRLFEEVRTRRGLSYGAYSAFPSRADEAVLSATAQTKNESADEVVQVILDQFARLSTEPTAADALEKRRLYLGGSTARQLETSGGFNALVAGLLLQGLEPGEAMRLAERLSAVSPEAAADVARRYVTPERASVIVVGNAAQFLDDLKKIRPDVEVIPASSLDLSSWELTR
jgi:zinc protease